MSHGDVKPALGWLFTPNPFPKTLLYLPILPLHRGKMQFETNPLTQYIRTDYNPAKYNYINQNYYKQPAPAQYAPILDSYTPFPSAVQESPASTIDKILFDRTDVLKDRIEFIIDQAQTRKDLYKSNSERIDEQECGIDSKIDMLDSWTPFRQLDPTVLRRKQGLEQELHQLHTERRREKIGAWGDIQMLYKDLMNTVQDYRSALRSENITRGEELGGN